MRKIILAALMAAFLASCASTRFDERDYVARMNADKRVWPPVVEGQAFPVQFMWDEH